MSETFIAVVAGSYDSFKALRQKLHLDLNRTVFFNHRTQGMGVRYVRVIYTCGHDRVDPMVLRSLKPGIVSGTEIEYVSCCGLKTPGTH